jgi:hypothetical protein
MPRHPMLCCARISSQETKTPGAVGPVGAVDNCSGVPGKSMQLSKARRATTARRHAVVAGDRVVVLGAVGVHRPPRACTVCAISRSRGLPTGGEQAARNADNDTDGVREWNLDDVRAEGHRERGRAGDELEERLEGADRAQHGDERAS